MITLTERAADQVRRIAGQIGGDGKVMRVFVKKGGCSGFEYGMAFDERKEGDLEVRERGVEIVLDPESFERLKGSEIDFDDGLNGKGFEVRNPNAASTCGCGKSFN